MPTFDNPTADATEASEALRGLAHASRVFDRPADMYGVIGDLASAMRSLHQVLGQLATAYETKTAFASTDSGDHEVGGRDALTAADELRHAARLLDASYDRLATGFVAAGRIAWHSQPAPETSSSHVLERQWVSVVFLQGDEADEVLDMIGTHGVEAAVEHLSGWDYGEEITGAAIANDEVYDAIPTGALDRTAEHGDYLLSYNPFMGHVALYRHPGPEPNPAPPPGAKPAPRRSATRDASRYQPVRLPETAQSQGRGLGL